MRMPLLSCSATSLPRRRKRGRNNYGAWTGHLAVERTRIFMAAALKLRGRGGGTTTSRQGYSNHERGRFHPYAPATSTIAEKKTTSRRGEGRASREEENKHFYEHYPIRYYRVS